MPPKLPPSNITTVKNVFYFLPDFCTLWVARIFFSFTFDGGSGISSIKFWFVCLGILYLDYKFNIISKVEILFMVPVLVSVLHPLKRKRERQTDRQTHLVSGCQFGPRFVSSPVIILSICYFHIFIEPQNLPGK